MTIRNLEKLLNPASVALIGASRDEHSVGLWLARNLARDFKGRLDFVNPRHDEIEGRRCFKSVDELPAAPDLAVIATPPTVIPGLITELGRKGTRAVIVVAAGVRSELIPHMLEASRPFTLRIQGPNCLGLMVPGIGLNASFSHIPAPAGDLAFVSQSGALITGIVDWAASRRIGFSHVVSLGDMADVDFGDMLDYLAGDTKSRAILLYMESLTQAPKFMSAARQAARAKPVIVVKAGRHAAGAKAAASHTGALSGSDRAYEAAFHRAGLLRVADMDELFNAAEMLAHVPRLEGERLTILTNGGGAGVIAADRISELDGRLTTLSPETIAALDKVLPTTWPRGNPVDIIGDADEERYAKALEILLADRDSDAILAINCPVALASNVEAARATVSARAKAAAKTGGHSKPLLANWLGGDSAAESRALFNAKGIASFETPGAAVHGFMQLVRYARAQEALMRTPPSLGAGITVDRARADAIIATALKAGRSILTEVESKALLTAYGIPTVETRIATSSPEVETQAHELLASAEAVVVKILSDDISHKSDIGGVKLNLASAKSAAEAASEMRARIERLKPSARIAGFTVQPMIRRPRAHELIVGMSEDVTFGPVLMFGAGGTSVEVVRDTCLALPPLDLRFARDMIAGTRVSRLLEGYRDRPPADIAAIACVLLRVSQLVIDHGAVRELDINPLLADEKGVIALDARVRVEDTSVKPRRPMALRPYPKEWEASRDVPGLGGQVLLRPIRPDDELLYDEFFEHMTEEDTRLRFFSPMRGLSHKFRARLTQIDYAREMAFVALDAAGRLLGVARLSADPDYTRAEFGVAVRSDLKGRGLGWLLMQHLIAYARAEGLKQLDGLVLVENTTMLAMSRELGFDVEKEPSDLSVRRATLKLR